MAKNYADLYNLSGDSIALEQRFYIKQEASNLRGVAVAPTGADFFFTAQGGSVEFTQPFEPSPHRSGRGFVGTIKGKKECSWTLPTLFNIDTTLGSGGAAEIDPALRVLWKSLLGKEVVSSGLIYTRDTPDISFTILETGDRWSRLVRGAFVQSANLQFPGDGDSMIEWSGNAKDALYVGIGKSITNNITNTVTLVTGDGKLFENAVGAFVMIVEANGTTRSTDTPDGSPRTVVSVVGDVVTLSGAPLVDADGSGLNAPIYLSYYEPATPVSINSPVTGLQGAITVDSMAIQQCVRTFTLTLTNNHEMRTDCYGSDSLDGSLFVPGSRMEARVSLQMNLNKEVMKLFKDLQVFTVQEIALRLGSATGRRFELFLPKVEFPLPSITVPEEGSIPVDFNDGLALQTADGAKDEVTASYL
ncbi:MAG: hypothetical protein RLZZ74_3437 [Cyanobacteriota bacterium]|jgi:hypothetical protein